MIMDPNARAALRIDRPTCQWELSRAGGPVRLRLYGVLGPRDLACIDFDEVEHLDYRAIPDFMARLGRQRERGASIWIVGLNPYLRALFQVAGQGPALARLEWGAAGGPASSLEDGRMSHAEAWDGMVA